MLFLIAALAAPSVSVVFQGESYQLQTARGDRIDAWSFAYHYDPAMKRVLARRVWTRRGLFWAGLAVGATSMYSGAIWSAGQSAGRGSQSGPVALVGTGAAIFLLTVPAAMIEKRATLRPQRYWTMEEATKLAARTSIDHGMHIITTQNGWAVINRVGRPLNAIEIASRLGDRTPLRRAKRRAFSVNIASTAMIGAGYVSLIAGMQAMSSEAPKTDTLLTGTGAVVMGSSLVVGGVLGRALRPRHNPKRYWSREQLEQLLNQP